MIANPVLADGDQDRSWATSASLPNSRYPVGSAVQSGPTRDLFENDGSRTALTSQPGGDALIGRDPNDHWWDGFNLPGTSADVLAFVEWNGSLVVAGQFAYAGKLRVNSVVMFDGERWTVLGQAMNDEIQSLAIYRGELIAGGQFTTADGAEAARIARWDGNKWNALGSGMSASGPRVQVSALTVYRDELIAAGSFTEAGGSPAQNIARWDGQTWQALGDGVSGGDDPWVRDLVVFHEELYVTGYFTRAGSENSPRVGRWDGTSWHPMLGFGVQGEALTVFEDQLIVAGWSGYVGRWNGIYWSPLGSGIPGSTSIVWDLAVHAGQLVLAGGAADDPGHGEVAIWDGNSWNSLDPLTWFIGAAHVTTVISYQGILFAGGSFGRAADKRMLYIAKWQDETWKPVIQGFGLNDPAETFVSYHGDLIVGGMFTHVGEQRVDGITKWNGSSFSALGSGMDDRVSSLTAYGENLVAGGWFRNAGGAPAEHVASWNGVGWSALGAGLTGPIYALTVHDAKLVAGGWVTSETPDGVVASWDGNEWKNLGRGMDGGVTSLIEYQGELIAGGFFRTADENPALYVARWNGTAWEQLGEGLAHAVHDLVVYRGNLVAACEGRWNERLPLIWSWDGTSWSPIGDASQIYYYAIDALAVLDGELYVGGDFPGDPDVMPPPHYIAHWDGSSWQPLGSGVHRPVWALGGYEHSLFAGGVFGLAGGQWSNYIARWDPVLVPIEVADLQARSTAGRVTLTWNHPRDVWRDLRSIDVERAAMPSGPYASVVSQPLEPAAEMRCEDANVEVGHLYWYRVLLTDNEGSQHIAGPVEVRVANTGSFATRLFQPAESTADGAIAIRYSVATKTHRIALSIYDVRGHLVRGLAPESAESGEYVRLWDRRDGSGARVARGMYLVRLDADGITLSKKLLLRR